MFHQVRLLSEDRPLLRFLWRDQVKDRPPDIYEWQVLPFGTTCSPCYATYALKRHITDHSKDGEDVRFSVERCFYVDNWLQSLPSAEEARALVDKLRALLLSAGFDLRQWASNATEVISHLPSEARSPTTELWLTQDKSDPFENTLGLSWNIHKDVIGYKHRPLNYGPLTMRNIYKVLASQYDPLGYILPYMTRAKVLVRQLWEKHRDWDDPLLPLDLQQLWEQWEDELKLLPQVTLPRHYTPAVDDASVTNRQIHIFCDASEQVYGSVAYLRTEDSQGQIHLSFLLARSRVAPRRQLSIPRLELSAALTGAQLAKLLSAELTLRLDTTTLWTDSTTVLRWILSDSCRYKVFVGTRVAEIQDLTDLQSWRYVDSASNPADDITRGKTLQELSELTRWNQGPSFLLQASDYWPTNPAIPLEEESSELRKSVFCGVTSTTTFSSPESETYKDWQELLESTAQNLQAAVGKDVSLSAEDYRKAERHIMAKIQHDSFPDEIRLLKLGKPVATNSRLRALAPQLDEAGEIRVGGRLRQAKDLELGAVHPIVLDPNHPFTRLLIQDYDRRLCHPGPERLFADIRRNFWILRGREAVRRHQSKCPNCRRWKSKPTIPQMADLPAARLRLYKPVFYSTGTDCFGPFHVKIGRRNEKRWGIIFKCLTTRAVHLDILTHLDVDSFLMALRRFIARRGTPSEILSDQGTNFRGAERELQQAIAKMSPDLQQSLAKQRIVFKFNPPGAPHFGGVWEREIRSVKTALYATVGAQPLPEEVLRTVLVEVEGILNSKPLGYVSSSVADPDPVTPNHLLMGRPDGSLPQVAYPATELPSKRRWRHSQALADHFWSRFIREYLPNLQVRQKWQTSQADLVQDTVVMLMDPQLPRALWPVGRVTKLHPSADGRIRSADVRVKDRIYTRPVARMIVLPAVPEDSNNHGSSSET
ncbi:uncharacterized protein LOC107833689 [Poecilia formosa]|uniref:uncharacterized protein LOC107833689 n=1 Tax=Poecilia formosa TaxID=48698 RepID=UPI0007B93329|nr:PREDICTED: uncharacterized protein LOC107833689 [Poecilia formosa]